MAHTRKTILDALKDRLATLAGFADDGKVSRARTSAINKEDLPALTVSWADDDEVSRLRPSSVIEGNELTHGYERTIPVSIVVHVADNEPEDAFDAIAELIEIELKEFGFLGEAVTDFHLISTRFYVDPTTGLSLGAGRLIYLLDYKTAADPSKPAI
ncbi:MAG: hypothetical protein ABJO86_00665 [Lentilitoribacter sp.]